MKIRQGSNALDSCLATERSSAVMLSAAKHLCAQQDRCFAALSMTRCDCSPCQGLFFTSEPCLNRTTCMSETLLQHGLSMSQTSFCPSKLISHVWEIPTAEILEFPSLEQIPDPLLGIEFGCIAGQAFQIQPFGCPSLQKGFNFLGSMDRRPIPDHQQLP